MKLPAELKAEDVCAICDTREQAPLNLAPLQVITATLPTGDYSVRGLENIVAVERKSLPDLVNVCGADRERFDREVQRLLAYPARCLVVEASYSHLLAREWRGQLTPQHVIGSVTGWMAAGLPVALVDNHDEAGKFVARFLYLAARRRWREARALVQAVHSQEATA